MTERLTAKVFESAIGTAFTVETDTGLIEFRLESADTRDDAATDPSDWVPFTLEFLGPVDPVLPQATYTFQHEMVGTHEIFVVPIGRDQEGTHYEAVFA